MLVNLLWFAFAVFIITLPVATAGLFAVLIPWARRRDTELFSKFFSTMRRQWLKSTIIFGATLLVLGLVYINFTALNQMELPRPISWMMRGINLYIGIMAITLNIYMWPLLVLFDLSLRRLFTVSLKMAFAHPLWSLLILILSALPIVAGLFVPLLFVIGVFAAVAFIMNWGAWRIIKKYATPEEIADLDDPFK
jgi:uncharacterized membrane protein YesL